MINEEPASRDQSFANCIFGPSVTCCSSLEPPESLRNKLRVADVYTIVRPSGDHTGNSADAEVNRLAERRSVSSSQRSLPPGRSRVAAARCPSGERRNGLLYTNSSLTVARRLSVRSNQVWLAEPEAL
jgi:hypothetical protein